MPVIVWKAELTADMVEDLTAEQLSSLIDCLDEAVEIVATDFGVGQ